MLGSTHQETLLAPDPPDSVPSVYIQASLNVLKSNFLGFGRRKRRSKGKEVLVKRDQKLNLETAHIAASFASISYCYDFNSVLLWNCTRCGLIPDFVLEESIVDEAWDVHSIVGYYPPWNAKIITFRGTDGSQIRNWIENLKATQHQVRLDLDGLDLDELEDCRVHNGFSRTWYIPFRNRTLTALDGLIKKYGEEGPLYIIGHSAGGATAQLAAMTIKLKLGLEDIHLYTFGAPRVGNKAFAKKITDLMMESWRFTHSRDIVPTLPWLSMGFWHSGQEVFQFEYPITFSKIVTVFKECDGTGEDPHGHNSMCPYGFGCSSIDNHLFYLNKVMENDEIC